MRTCVESSNIENGPSHSAGHGYIGAEWKGQGAVPLEESHWFDGGQEGPTNIVSSTKYDEDSKTANCIVVCDEGPEVREVK